MFAMIAVYRSVEQAIMMQTKMTSVSVRTVTSPAPRVDAVVASPVRFLFNTLLEQLQVLVVDEADRLQELGQWPLLPELLETCGPERLLVRGGRAWTPFSCTTIERDALAVWESAPNVSECVKYVSPIESMQECVNRSRCDVLAVFRRHVSGFLRNGAS